MVQLLVKFLKRLAIFLPGIIIAYVSWRYTLPFFHKRIPYVLAILVTYAVAAYILIPALLRSWRLLFPPKHLPLYCITPDGFASDPLNIGIVCTRHELITTMEKAGWYKCDNKTISTAARQALSILFGQKYSHSPVSSLYLFGRKQDLAFTKPVHRTNLKRHHVRFWATTFESGTPISSNSINWHDRKAHVYGDELLWVGAASLDIGIIPIRHNLQLTHMVDPDTNKEREVIIKNIGTSKIEAIQKLKLGDPYTLVNRAWRGELNTDGIMKVLRFKKQP